ncbi:MAG TPA: carbon starvation CstA family protein, partial [Rhodanobacter sp.]|nr:carbon starvation CstA family protein [Rhodanobacter sp.]
MHATATSPSPAGKILWAAIAIVGAFCLGVVALRRGEPINAIWLVAASIAVFVIGYRFYSLFINDKVLQLDPSRATPAVLRNDGLDYVPTDKWVVFGHHFAAIAGAGPLVGPVLAAQMGYLPGTIWILFGVVFAGAVQDFMILGLSIRRDGRSLGNMLRDELGPVPGIVAMIGVLVLMMIVLAVLALVVVKALTHSPWGTFTVAATIPIALLMGVYLRWFRAGRILEVSIIGLVLLLVSIWAGRFIAESATLAPLFDFDARALAWLLIGYGFFASVLPVWLLLAPRDYLSTFLKIGTIALLALAIFLAAPTLQMPAVTQFIDGSGPVFSGDLFPFLFITIACGAVSGWH